MSLTNFSKRKDKISVRDHIEIANVEIATVEGRASCCSCSKCWGRIRIDLFVVVSCVDNDDEGRSLNSCPPPLAMYVAAAVAAMETAVISPQTTSSGEDDVVVIVVVDIVAAFDWFDEGPTPPDDATPPSIAATKGGRRHRTQLSILHGIAIGRFGRIQWVLIVMTVMEMVIVTVMMRRRVVMR